MLIDADAETENKRIQGESGPRQERLRGEVLLRAILLIPFILSRQNRNDRMFRMYRIQDFRHDTNPAKSSRLRRQTADIQLTADGS